LLRTAPRSGDSSDSDRFSAGDLRRSFRYLRHFCARVGSPIRNSPSSLHRRRFQRLRGSSLGIIRWFFIAPLAIISFIALIYHNAVPRRIRAQRHSRRGLATVFWSRGRSLPSTTLHTSEISPLATGGSASAWPAGLDGTLLPLWGWSDPSSCVLFPRAPCGARMARITAPRHRAFASTVPRYHSLGGLLSKRYILRSPDDLFTGEDAWGSELQQASRGRAPHWGRVKGLNRRPA